MKPDYVQPRKHRFIPDKAWEEKSKGTFEYYDHSCHKPIKQYLEALQHEKNGCRISTQIDELLSLTQISTVLTMIMGNEK